MTDSAADEWEPWTLTLHPSGQYKMLQREGERGVYYFPAGPEQVTDAVCNNLNRLERAAAAVSGYSRILRASVPERWKHTTSAVGGVQSYVAELEDAAGGLLTALRNLVEEAEFLDVLVDGEFGVGNTPKNPVITKARAAIAAAESAGITSA